MKRRITTDSLCLRCQQAEETPLHATWECSSCVVVPLRAGLCSKLHLGTFSSFSLLLEKAMEVLSVDEVKLLVVILWANCNERCAIFHGNQPKSSKHMFESAISIWKCLLAVDNLAATGSMGGNATDQRVNKQWRPPPPHVLKMNCDGSVVINMQWE